MNKSHSGFTLIELMIVIAIIGILAAVAVPQYTLYTTRAFVANEGLNGARSHQLAVSEFVIVNQSLPEGPADITIPSDGETPKVESVTVAEDGSSSLSVLFKGLDAGVPALVAGETLILTPEIDPTTGQLSWAVGAGSSVDAKYVPKL